MYSGCGQFVRPDRAFPEQLRLWSAEVEDGAGLGEGGGAGVDEEGDAAVELVEDGGGCRAWGDAAAVGAGGGEGADAAGERAQEWLRGKADADGVAAGGEGGGQVAARGEYERERAGPVAFDEGLGRGVGGRAYYCACLLCVTEQDGQRFMVRALLDCKQLVDGGGIATEANKAVDGIGGDADDGTLLHCGGGLFERAGLVSRDNDCHRFCSATDEISVRGPLRSGRVCASAKGCAVFPLLCAVYTLQCPVYTTDGLTVRQQSLRYERRTPI